MKETKINLLIFLINKVDYYWNLFYITNGSLLTLLLINTLRTKNMYFMVMLTLIYMGFIFFCYRAHIRAYRFLQDVISDLKQSVDLKNEFPLTYRKLNSLSYHLIMKVTLYIYIIIGVMIIYLLWSESLCWENFF